MLDRNTPPSIQRIPALTLAAPERYDIHSNLPLFVFPDASQPVVQLTFVVPKRSSQHAQDGLALDFLIEMLAKGTQHQDKAAIAALLDHHGAHLDARSGEDLLTFGLKTLAKHTEKLLPCFADMLQNPTFPDKEVALQQSLEIQEVRLRKATPQHLAKDQLFAQVFGKNHPYGYFPEETTLQALTPAQLRSAFEGYGWPQGIVTLTGDVTPVRIAATQQALREIPYHTLDKHRHALPPRPEPLAITTAQPTQTSMAMGMPTITRTHPDYPRLYLLNVVLGGYFGSRLMQNIREEKGYTYGIMSRLCPFLDHGFLYITTEVKAGMAEKTRQEIFAEMARLRNEPIPTQELEAVRAFLRGHLLAAFQDTFALPSHFAHLYFHGLTLDHYTALYDAVQSITPADLQASAQTYFDPEKLTQVTVN